MRKPAVVRKKKSFTWKDNKDKDNSPTGEMQMKVICQIA